MGRTIAYVRVSTSTQDVEMQELAIYKYCAQNGIEISEENGDIIRVVMSTRRSHVERQIKRLYVLGDGDTCIFYSVSRLGRDIGGNLRVVEDLVNGGVKIIFLKEGLVLDIKNNTAISKMQVAMWSFMAEAERELKSLSTKDGLANARARGKVLGWRKGVRRTRKLDKYAKDLLVWRYDLGLSIQKIKDRLYRKKVVDGMPFECTVQTISSWYKDPDNQSMIKKFKEDLDKA